MIESINGVTCIKGEIHSIITLMRLNSRWSQTSKITRESLYHEEGSLMKSFRKLNEYLEGIFDLAEVDCVAYVVPFYDIIVSDKASGPLTGAALSSLTKFVLYGFLNPSYPRVKEGVALIASSISHCVFEETDWESDELILMKLLELAALCFRCEASNMLTIGSAWDIYNTCISIHNHYRASKILKSEAETALVHLTVTSFNRAVGLMKRQPASGSGESVDQADSIRLNTWDAIGQSFSLSSELGTAFLLSKIMSVLSELSDLQKNSVEYVKFSLFLINIALESGGLAIGSINLLVGMLRNDICRNLLRASQTEDLAILSLALRVVFNLFMSIKDHMKVQLEVFLTSVHLRLINFSSPAKEELALESLLEFCREPSLMQDLYTNYDCDVQCTNLFDSIIAALCVRALPKSLQGAVKSAATAAIKPAGGNGMASPQMMITADGDPYLNSASALDVRLNILNKLAFDGLLAVLHSVAVKCNSDSTSKNLPSAIKQQRGQQSSEPSTPDRQRSSSTVFADLQSLPNFGNASLDANAVSLPSSAIKERDVDRWCDISDTNSILSTDEYDLRSAVGGPVGSTSVVGVHRGSSGSLSSLPSESTTAIDGENEDTTAVLEARAKTAEVLRHRKLMKQKFKLAGDKFNAKPLKKEWIQFAIDLGILKPIASDDSSLSSSLPADSAKTPASTGTAAEVPLADAKSVAEFLRYTPGLGKVQIGEYISKGPPDLYPFNANVLKEYVNLFDFSGVNSSFDKALRMFLGHFRLPGEAQCIDRIMEAFAGRLFQYLGPGKPFANADAAFILSFSTIMLNTDLHNPGIPLNKKMTKQEFIRNNRGINDNKDLPLEYLENLYDEIKSRQIQVDFGIADSSQQSVDYTDSVTWNKLIRQSSDEQAPAVFTPTLNARKNSSASDAMTLSSGSMQFITSFQSSLHDRDMFLMMSKPLLETILALWENSTDDNVVARAFKGIWDYAFVCINLGLHSMLSSLIQLLSFRARNSLIISRSIPLKPISRKNALAYRNTSKQWKTDSGHDLNRLVALDFDTLIKSGKESNAASAETAVNWTESNLVKGELLVKIVLQAARLCTGAVNEEAWMALCSLLIWCRSRGSLPEPLCEVEDIFSGTSNFTAEQNANPSVYGRICYLNAYGVATQDIPHLSGKNVPVSAATGNVSIARRSADPSRDSKSSWIFSLLSSGSDTEGGYSRVNMSSEAVMKLMNSSSLYSNANASIYINLNGESIRIDDELLKSSLSACRPHEVLYGQTSDSTELVEAMLVNSLLKILNKAMDTVLAVGVSFSASQKESKSLSLVKPSTVEPSSNDSNNVLGVNESYFPDYLLAVEFLPPDVVELDLVVLLEWIYGIVSVNASRLHHNWAKLHGFFKTVFEDKLDLLSAKCPYFIERCVVCVLRATVQLTNSSNSFGSTELTARSFISPRGTESISSSGLESVWLTLRLMRGMSGEIIGNLSGRIGCGVHMLLRGSTANAVALTLEQWYMVFSLLSAATSGNEGRAFVWQSICYLLEHDLVNDMNFTPCRHLVLRFLHGVFPGEAQDKDQSSIGGTKQWLMASISHLMTLTLMSLAGYVKLTSSGSSSSSAVGPNKRLLTAASASAEVNPMYKTPSKSAQPTTVSATASVVPINSDVVAFPMPPPSFFSPLNSKRSLHTNDVLNFVDASEALSFVSPSTALKVLPSSNPTDLESSSSSVPKVSPLFLSLKCVVMGRSDEIEQLWLETCKIYSELANSPMSNVSLRAIYCLRAIISAGKFVALPNQLWLKCLNELISRLPVYYVTAASRGSNHSMMDSNDSVDCCQRCCNVVFDVLLDQIKVLRDNVEFQSIWIRFLGTLSANAQASNKGQQIHEEMIEMLESLLRLLRLPKMVQPESEASPSAVVKAPTPVPVVKPVVPQQNTGGWFGWLVGENNPAPSVESAAQNSVTGSSNTTPSRTVMMLVDEAPELNDGMLIMSSWKAVTSAYPAFAGNMKVKNPKLLSSLTMFMEASENHTRVRSVRAMSAEDVKAAPTVSVKPVPAAAAAAPTEAKLVNVPVPSPVSMTAPQPPLAAVPSTPAVHSGPASASTSPKSGINVQTV